MKSSRKQNGIARRLLKKLAEQNRFFHGRTVRIIFYLAIIYIAYLFCAGDYGLFRIYRLTRERNELKQEYLSIAAEAIDYSGRLHRLKTDPNFVEWLARTQYGFSRPGETIYHLQLPAR